LRAIIITILLLIYQPLKAYDIVFSANEKLVEQNVAQYIIEDIYKSIGLNLKVFPMPPKRAMLSNLNRSVDGEIARITPYGDDKPSLIRIEPSYYHLDSAAYCLKTSKINITKREDLEMFRVARIRGVAHSNHATVNVKNVVDLNGATHMFEFLLRKRADVVIDTEINGRRLLEQDKFKHKIKLCGIFKRYELFNYINENKKDILEKVSKKIGLLKNTGKLKYMIQKAERKALLMPSKKY